MSKTEKLLESETENSQNIQDQHSQLQSRLVEEEQKVSELLEIVEQLETKIEKQLQHHHEQFEKVLQEKEQDMVSLEQQFEVLTQATKGDELKCLICKSLPKSILFFPCKHICTCSECSNVSNCPACQLVIESSLEIYL